MSRSYKDLIVWKKSMDLVMRIYDITDSFPKSELFGLTNQIRKSAISIPSNISEGKMRFSDQEFRRFLKIAYGSAAELETQLEIARRLGFGDIKEYLKVENLLTEILKMLNKLIYSI